MKGRKKSQWSSSVRLIKSLREYICNITMAIYVCTVKSIDISEGLFCWEVEKNERGKNSSRNQQWQCG